MSAAARIPSSQAPLPDGAGGPDSEPAVDLDAVEPEFSEAVATDPDERDGEGYDETEPHFDPEQPSEDLPADGLRWSLHTSDPGNPFTTQLVFSDAEGDILWWDLNPVAIREFRAALDDVHADQVAVLTGHRPQPDAPTVEEDETPAKPDAQTRREARRERRKDPTRPWWQRHKAATFLIVLVGFFFLYAFIAGGTQV